MGLVSLDDIRAAAARLAGVATRTPLLPQAWSGDALLLKPESLQPVGSFKIRGAYNKVAALSPEARARGVVTHSSGNHAQAVAYAAARFGVPAVVVMPDVAPAVKVAATRRWGAEVVLVPPAERAARADALASERGLTPVPPYDDRDVIAGQGTVGLEVAEDLPEVGVVLVPVSGGGLVSGVAAAVKALAPSARVVGVEPAPAAHARDSLRRGEPVAWSVADTYRTIADALRVPRLGDLTWEHLSALVDDVVTVTDDEIREAMAVLALRSRLVAEPGGAVATAAWLHHRDSLPAHGPAVALVTGGNVDPALFAEVLAPAGDRDRAATPPRP